MGLLSSGICPAAVLWHLPSCTKSGAGQYQKPPRARVCSAPSSWVLALLQMALMGVPVALTVGIGVGFLNFFTLWLLVVLFLERKRYMVSSACAMLRMLVCAVCCSK